MQTRTYVSALISSMVNAVIFGAGAIAVLTIPGLNLWIWLPIVIAVSFIAAPVIAWRLAPRLMQRYRRRREAMSRMPRHAAR